MTAAEKIMARNLRTVSTTLTKLGFAPIDMNDPEFEKIIRGMRGFPMTFLEFPGDAYLTIVSDDTSRIWIKVGKARGLSEKHFTDFFDEIDNRRKPPH
jgi:hypothetical protein